MPGPEEVAAHAIAHIPARRWCRWCTVGKAKQLRHRVVVNEEREPSLPLIQMEYLYMKATGESTKIESEAWATTLVIVHVGAGFAQAAEG